MELNTFIYRLIDFLQKELEQPETSTAPVQAAPALSVAPAPAPAFQPPPPAPSLSIVRPVPNGSSGATAANPGAQTDIKGAAWNPEIHSSSKQKNKDGTWRIKRGLDRTSLPEQPALPATPGPVPPFVGAPPPINTPSMQIPTIPPAQPMSNYIIEGQHLSKAQLQDVVVGTVRPDQVAYLVPPTHVAPAVSQYQVGGNQRFPFDFFKTNFVGVFRNLHERGKINQEYIDSLKAHFQVPELWDILKNEEQSRGLYDSLCAHGLITRVE